MVGVFSSSFCCHCYDCYSKPFLFIAEQHNDGIPMFPMWTSKETPFSPQIYRTMEHKQRLATKLFLMSFWRKRPLKRTEFLVRIIMQFGKIFIWCFFVTFLWHQTRCLLFGRFALIFNWNSQAFPLHVHICMYVSLFLCIFNFVPVICFLWCFHGTDVKNDVITWFGRTSTSYMCVRMRIARCFTFNAHSTAHMWLLVW